jgi:translation initiation factor 2-alpha kinase 4
MGPDKTSAAAATLTFSRYKQDFEEIDKIGEGGAGRVFRARHRIDKTIYAIKKVRLYRKD